MIYREERKYLCSDADLQILQHRLSNFVPMDMHQTGNSYHIRSVYFDTYDDTCFYENQAGIDGRNKYRIRAYNLSQQKISFEIKEKLHEKTRKETWDLSPADFSDAMSGNIPVSVLGDTSSANRIFLEQHMHLLRPKVIIDYERTAFVYPVGNVRITFDRNISASSQVDGFWDSTLPLTPILEPHMHILEVKYDELLPDFILTQLDLGHLRRTSFSKYYLARQALDTAAIL